MPTAGRGGWSGWW